MGLAPLTRPAGQTSQTDLNSYRLIPLASCPILGSSAESGLPSGVVFSGRSFDAASDNALSCCGRYNLRNSLHQGVAAIGDDGHLMFAVNSWVSGQRCTVMGAFDPMGKPVALTKPSRICLENISSRPSVPSFSIQRRKATSASRRMGSIRTLASMSATRRSPYVKARSSDGKTEGSATITTDFNGKVQDQLYELSAKGNNSSLSGSYERRGTQTAESLKASWDKWSLEGKHSRDGTSRNRELNLSYRATDKITIKASWRPDVKPPSTPPRITNYSIFLGHQPQSAADPSQL